ncbi:exodeoxyribonuclease V subunit alpha [Intrasporangium sp.]|uniref:exodeoxyribonuclease V subunit alpha n=1 Tax=Intrasporangium sp. TaxID=1925024 RepID=UPI003221FE25
MTASDPGDAALSVTASGRLRVLNEAGFLDGSDCVIAARVSTLVGEDVSGDAALALAFAVRAVREGSTALDLGSVADLSVDLAEVGDARSGAPRSRPESEQLVRLGDLAELPDPAEWFAAVRASPLAAQGVLRPDLGLVYLERNHADECLIAKALQDRRDREVSPVDQVAVTEALQDRGLDEAQLTAVRRVTQQAVTVLTGGPGMGKTYTIAGVLAALAAGSRHTLRIGLAAPTGKAAARMNETLQDALASTASISPAVTVHRLLGSRPDSRQRFRHDAHNPLPHDVVVIDEASMVSLSLMARLVEALPPTARLLLVGDPDQLASVEAGSVLADLVRGLEGDGSVVRLTKDHRLDDDRARLARAFRTGAPGSVLDLVARAATGLTFVETEAPTLGQLPEVVEHAWQLRELALDGDVAAALAQLGRFRLLCAHRTGPFGTRHWNRLVEQALAARAPEVAMHPMYVGRPILVTRNDYGLGVSNGDTGVVVRTGDGPLAAVETGSGTRAFAPWRLSDIETMHAMTVHKAQGSQAEHVAVIVPPTTSRLLTRELLYTAVTRAEHHLTIVGSRAAIRAAVETPAQRSSGLAQRLARPGVERRG